MIQLSLIVFLLLGLASCSHLNDTKPAEGRKAPAAAQQHHDKKQIDITTNDPQKGIDSYEAELTRHPHDQTLTRDYIKDLEELRASADRASERGNCAQAGRLYAVLIKNYHKFADLSKRLSFTKDYVNTKLTSCKTTLSRKGFEEYRRGNLDEAIGYWQSYLTIDPNNADIKKAVHTASTQRKNLEQKR